VLGDDLSGSFSSCTMLHANLSVFSVQRRPGSGQGVRPRLVPGRRHDRFHNQIAATPSERAETPNQRPKRAWPDPSRAGHVCV